LFVVGFGFLSVACGVHVEMRFFLGMLAEAGISVDGDWSWCSDMTTRQQNGRICSVRIKSMFPYIKTMGGQTTQPIFDPSPAQHGQPERDIACAERVL
jgi:hypothetical protein